MQTQDTKVLSLLSRFSSLRSFTPACIINVLTWVIYLITFNMSQKSKHTVESLKQVGIFFKWQEFWSNIPNLSHFNFYTNFCHFITLWIAFLHHWFCHETKSNTTFLYPYRRHKVCVLIHTIVIRTWFKRQHPNTIHYIYLYTFIFLLRSAS